MVYAGDSDALPYLRRLNLSSSSIVTLADLDTFLAQRGNQIDAALKSRGLQTPLTSPPAPPEFLAELVALNAKGAAADVMLALYVTNDGNDRGTGAALLKEFTDRINQLRQGVGVPVSVPVAEADLAVHSLWTDANAIGTDGVNQFGERVPAAPVFSMGRRF